MLRVSGVFFGPVGPRAHACSRQANESIRELKGSARKMQDELQASEAREGALRQQLATLAEQQAMYAVALLCRADSVRIITRNYAILVWQCLRYLRSVYAVKFSRIAHLRFIHTTHLRSTRLYGSVRAYTISCRCQGAGRAASVSGLGFSWCRPLHSGCAGSTIGHEVFGLERGGCRAAWGDRLPPHGDGHVEAAEAGARRYRRGPLRRVQDHQGPAVRRSG